MKESYGTGKLLLELYEKTTESTLWNPTFVTDYPTEVSPLSRVHRSNPLLTERFEGADLPFRPRQHSGQQGKIAVVRADVEKKIADLKVPDHETRQPQLRCVRFAAGQVNIGGRRQHHQHVFAKKSTRPRQDAPPGERIYQDFEQEGKQVGPRPVSQTLPPARPGPC